MPSVPTSHASMIREEDLYQIGVLTRTHGTRGEVSMTFTDDVWDRVDADYVFLQVDGLFVPFFLEEWRFRSDNVALLKFEDTDTPEEAQMLVGCTVWFERALTPAEVDDEDLTWQMFTGFEVVDEGTGRHIGKVAHVEDSTANVLLEIETPEDERVLVPACEEFVVGADHQRRVVFAHIPEELLTLNR